MSKPWAFVLSCGVVYAHSNASASLPVTFVIGNNRLNVRNCTAFALMRPSFRYAGSAGRGARSSRPTRRQRWLRMDDEIARQGIKEELTTRDEYLATRFTKLSASQHDLTPLMPLEIQEAASHLSARQRTVLLEGATEANEPGASGTFRDHREKGLYACAVGGLPLFTSGWKLEPRAGDAYPSFAEPCDDEHLLERYDAESEATVVSCARSRLRVGTLVDDVDSPSGKRYLITNEALEFHPLGKALPVRCQPENYWGSEGQYRAWVLEEGSEAG